MRACVWNRLAIRGRGRDILWSTDKVKEEKNKHGVLGSGVRVRVRMRGSDRDSK